MHLTAASEPPDLIISSFPTSSDPIKIKVSPGLYICPTEDVGAVPSHHILILAVSTVQKAVTFPQTPPPVGQYVAFVKPIAVVDTVMDS